MPVTHEIVAHGEKYTTADGQEKSRLINIGKVIEKANGKLAIKLDTIPLNWDGWAMMLPPRPKDDAQPQRSKPVASRVPGSDDDLADDIPF
jgi:hypothetical protein